MSKRLVRLAHVLQVSRQAVEEFERGELPVHRQHGASGWFSTRAGVKCRPISTGSRGAFGSDAEFRPGVGSESRTEIVCGDVRSPAPHQVAAGPRRSPRRGRRLGERACLARHAAGKRRLAEIGVWHGGSARELRAAMAPDATLFAIDPYVPGRFGVSIPRIVGRRELRRSTNGTGGVVEDDRSGRRRSEPVRQMAPLDFVFVDAAQTYEGLRRRMGGVVAAHLPGRNHRPS